MFAAMIELQREPAGAGCDARAGRTAASRSRWRRSASSTTAVSIVLACIPADEEPNKTLAVVKVVGSSLVLVALGAAVYLAGRRRAMSPA